MKTLNLVDIDKSDIKYKISRYPDGQQQVTLEALKDDLEYREYKDSTLIKIKDSYYSFDSKKFGWVRNKAPQNKGVIELLWDIFGGIINEQGYKVLDSHIGAIYGDSITLERAEEICKRLKAKGFASTNIVLGIGSYSMGYTTRDNQGGAVKSTYVEVNGEEREIFKDPITDDGTKKSKKGLLCVIGNETSITKDIFVVDQCNWEQEKRGLLTTVFKDGKVIKETTLEQIRTRLEISIK